MALKAAMTATVPAGLQMTINLSLSGAGDGNGGMFCGGMHAMQTPCRNLPRSVTSVHWEMLAECRWGHLESIMKLRDGHVMHFLLMEAHLSALSLHFFDKKKHQNE